MVIVPRKSVHFYQVTSPLSYRDPDGLQPDQAEINRLAQQLQTQANTLLDLLRQGSTAHALRQGTFEAAIAEAQGAQLVGPGGQTYQHLQNLRNATTAINNAQQALTQSLDALRRTGTEGARAVEALRNSLQPLLQQSRQFLQLSAQTEEVISELRATGNAGRLAGVPLETGRSVTAQLQNLRLNLVPNAIRESSWVQQTLDRIRQLPTTLGQVRDQARQIATTVGASLSAYATAGRAAASRAGVALVNFFGRALPLLEAIGSRLISIPLIIIIVDENGNPIGMPRGTPDMA